MAYCPKCGNFVPDDAKVCEFCGTAMDSPAEVIYENAEGAQEAFAEAAGEVVTDPGYLAASINEGAAQAEQNAAAFGAGAAEGTRNADDAAPAPESGETVTSTETGSTAGGTSAPKAGGNKKGIVIGIVAVVAIVILLCCLCGGFFTWVKFIKKPQVVLDKNVEYSYGTYNGYGSFEVDYTKIKKKYAGKIKYVKGQEFPKYSEPIDALLAECVTVKAEPGSNYKNGDKVKVTWTVDEKKVKQHFKATVKAKNFEFKVKGLTDVATYDAFEGVYIEAQGVDGYGRVDLITRFPADSPSNDYRSYFKIEDRKEYYSNGDEVKVVINYSGDIYDRCARDHEKVPDTIEKTFTVTGLTEVVSVDPFEELKIEFTGTDPYGKIQITNNNSNAFARDIRFEIIGAENGKLKNGDKIVLSAQYGGRTGKDLVDYGKQYKAVNLTQTEKEITITELAKAEEIDPFADLKLEFKGHEPYGTLRLSKGGSNEVVSGLTFTADKAEELSNGDVITVTVTRETWGGSEDPEEYALKHGVVLKSLTKTYTVEGLSKYYTEMDEIPAETLEAMKKESVDAWTEIASKMNNYNLSSLDYLGGVILARKGEWNSYGNNTYVFLVYKMNGNIDYTGFDGTCNDAVGSYVYVRFENVEEVDGKTVVDVNRHEESNGYYQRFEYDTGVHSSRYSSDTTTIDVRSYENLADLGEEVITKNRNNYNYTTNVKGLSEAEEPSTEPESESESEAE